MRSRAQGKNGGGGTAGTTTTTPADEEREKVDRERHVLGLRAKKSMGGVRTWLLIDIHGSAQVKLFLVSSERERERALSMIDGVVGDVCCNY